MTETSTTPQPCPPWCTTEHDPGDYAKVHTGRIGGEIVNAAGLPAVAISVLVAASDIPGEAPKVSLAHSTTTPGSRGGGVALLDPRDAVAVGGLLRALGHAATADAIDRAVTTLDGACASDCCGDEPCVLSVEHGGEHLCRRCVGPRGA